MGRGGRGGRGGRDPSPHAPTAVTPPPLRPARLLLGLVWEDTVMASSLVALKLIKAQTALESILVDPRYHDLLALLKTARNGAVYGTKVRFPHALV
ncbi:hypothetical protein E4U42_002303 [Claviceps africana]|uniref:Uncharacterized protein n=1 Tax=Claviceps africana TaxID=83212 RepID=A0A8K0JEE5_9HYPO|nr:hypothetical protein E4U42_002303 [Claviceps africana]